MKQRMSNMSSNTVNFKTLLLNRVLLKTAIIASMVIATSQMALAESFSFDRPGAGLGTAIVPKGHVAWEQSLPTATYDERRVDGVDQSQLTLQGDALFRIGVADDVELRVGWDGPIWQRNKDGANDTEIDGTGDVIIGVKKAIETNDENFTWAVLAEANLANGDDEFTAEEEIYTVASAIGYNYSDDVSTGITMIYDYQDGDLAWSAIPSVGYSFSENVSGFSEYVYRKQESQHYESMINTGVMWMVNDRFQLDAMIGYSFNQQNPRFTAGLGFGYLF